MNTPALVRGYFLVASIPGLCEVCHQDRRMWLYTDGQWTFMPCPHCTDATPMTEMLETEK